jgi:hypothetical protein
MEWQEQQPSAARSDQLLGPYALIKADIADDDDIAGWKVAANCVSIHV